MDVRSLIPKDKHDHRVISKLKKLSFEDIQPIVPDLLIWLQDMHWPIAIKVAKVLKPFADRINSEVLPILTSNDELWVLGVLNHIARYSTDLDVIRAIERIAKFPKKDEVENCVDEIAMEILLEMRIK